MAALRLCAGKDTYVFGGGEPLSRNVVEAAHKRMLTAEEETDRAPAFDWQRMRRTTASFLVNACIYGAAAAYRESRLLGHSIAIAERHYAGAIPGIPHTVRTLEGAMRVERELDFVLRAVRRSDEGESTRPRRRPRGRRHAAAHGPSPRWHTGPAAAMMGG